MDRNIQLAIQNLNLMIVVLLLPLLYLIFPSTALAKPLKAFLYGVIPAYNYNNKEPEFQHLRTMLNQRLVQHGINVEVEIALKNWTMLYSDQINNLLDIYDIVEIDLVVMPEIKRTLMNFTREEISDYDEMFQFQWVTKKIIGERQYCYALPRLICDNFLMARRSGGSSGQMYLNEGFSNFQAMDLYSQLLINLGRGQGLEDIDYQNIDEQALQLLANFLAQTQRNQQYFDYDQSTCKNSHIINIQKQFSDKLSTIMGYSETIYSLLAYNPNISTSDIKLSGTFDYNKKLIYLDQFIAKQCKDDLKRIKKKTILQFYQFMVSDEVYDIYMHGLYTTKPRNTFMIPGKISYFNRLKANNSIYQQIYQVLFEDKQIIINYSPNYWKNLKSLLPSLKEALRAYSKKIKSHRFSRHIL